MRALLCALGQDAASEALRRTPERVAAMYAELLAGEGIEPSSVLDVSFTEAYDELVLLRDVPVASLCEHHLLPFVGSAHVGYIPAKTGRITGLGQLARLVDVLARRLQVQERLTAQIADAIEAALVPRGVIVVVEAEHMCMSLRGVRTPGTTAVTSAVRGLLRRNAATRAEAMAVIGGRRWTRTR